LRFAISGGKFTLYQPIILYRKFKADNIFTGTQMLPAENVLITTTGGIVKEIIPAKDAGDDVEILAGILSPGFINCHCHIELSHMKGQIAEHTGLVNFVQQVMSNRSATEEQKQQAMKSAEEELWQSGIVAVGDICNTVDSVSLKKNSYLYWHNFIEISGFVNAVVEKRLAAAEEVLHEFIITAPSTISHQLSTLSPHAPYSVSKKLFQLLNDKTARQLISIHNQEAAAENELYKNKSGDFLKLYKNFGIDISSFDPTGKTSLQSWLPYFTNDQSIISVHNTFTSEEDIATSNQQSAINYCICINANLYIENSLPPLKLLMDNNCNIVLGTDSYASNHHLNMYEEIKSIQKYFPEIPLETILQWATSNGAKVLGIENKYGKFDTGKQPGVVLINQLKNTTSRIV
jgi:cytosine/adenosine deaminase-related metal-dependent hydrolase